MNRLTLCVFLLFSTVGLAAVVLAGCSGANASTVVPRMADDDDNDDDNDNDTTPDDDDDSSPDDDDDNDDDDNDDASPDDDDDNDATPDDDDNDDNDASPADDDDDNDTAPLPPGWMVDPQANGYTDLALDSQQNPRVAYYESGTGLKYAAWNGSSWDKTEVDTANGQMGMYAAITMDPTGTYAYIAYQDGQAQELKFAQETASGWQTAVVDNATGVGAWAAIAATSSDIFISYNDNTAGALKVAHKSTAWATETVAPGPNSGQYTSIGVDSGGTVYVSFYDGDTRSLNLAYGGVGNWTVTALDTPGNSKEDVGSWTSLKIDGGDHVQIAYQDNYNLALKYGVYASGSWSMTTVDGVGGVGADACLMVDAANLPHIVYQDESNLSVKYATSNGSAWTLSVLIDGTYYQGAFGFWMGCGWLTTAPVVSSIWEPNGGLLIYPAYGN